MVHVTCSEFRTISEGVRDGLWRAAQKKTDSVDEEGAIRLDEGDRERPS